MKKIQVFIHGSGEVISRAFDHLKIEFLHDCLEDEEEERQRAPPSWCK